MPASGHWYFSLKDASAQVRAVVWKTAARLIKFKPRDGMKVLVRGAVRVYPPKGEYQIAVEVIEPLGKGSLQQAFEELKAKLEKEGLFAAARKRPLPMLPRRIAVLTSPTGAVIQDILRVVERRLREPGDRDLSPRACRGRKRCRTSCAASAPSTAPPARRADRGPRRRQPRGPLALQRGVVVAALAESRSRPSPPSGTRRTSRSRTSWPTCARPRRRRRRRSWVGAKDDAAARASTRCAAAPMAR
jgi:hypothetical protein